MANIETGTSNLIIDCPGGIPCSTYANSSQPITSAPMQWGMWQLRVVDALTGNVVCHSAGGVEGATYCSLPPRTAAEAPHPYRVILSLAGEPSVAPNEPITSTSFTDQLVGASWITGGVHGIVTGCTSLHSSGSGWYCTQEKTYQQVSVVNQARIALDSITVSIKTDLGTDDTALVPGYVTASQLTLGARTWDAGNAGF
jgi:hypothetical protein